MALLEAAREWAVSVLPPELAAAAGGDPLAAAAGGDPLAALAATTAALVAGLLVLAFWLRFGGSAPPKPHPASYRPPPVKVDVDDVDDADDGRKRVTIFFGNQTGTAEGFAKAMAEEAKARYDKAVFKVVDLDDYAAEDDVYEEKLKKETFALFFLATWKCLLFIYPISGLAGAGRGHILRYFALKWSLCFLAGALTAVAAAFVANLSVENVAGTKFVVTSNRMFACR
ncbi:hypothetical protein ZWY2020_053768 [Hordeum vulgare]|nr:hypothetical protein ZWY2020_053768 [Hordeum vulgare]